MSLAQYREFYKENPDAQVFRRISNGARGTQFGTDWVDFNASMLSIGVYLLAVVIAETVTHIKTNRSGLNLSNQER